VSLVYSNWKEDSSQTNLLRLRTTCEKWIVFIGVQIDFVAYAHQFKILSHRSFSTSFFCLRGKPSLWQKQIIF
jgi:hypothetical protein